MQRSFLIIAYTPIFGRAFDVAVPGVAAPRILIMASYQLTTSSSQSSKANEQVRMYEAV